MFTMFQLRELCNFTQGNVEQCLFTCRYNFKDGIWWYIIEWGRKLVNVTKRSITFKPPQSLLNQLLRWLPIHYFMTLSVTETVHFECSIPQENKPWYELLQNKATNEPSLSDKGSKTSRNGWRNVPHTWALLCDSLKWLTLNWHILCTKSSSAALLSEASRPLIGLLLYIFSQLDCTGHLCSNGQCVSLYVDLTQYIALTNSSSRGKGRTIGDKDEKREVGQRVLLRVWIDTSGCNQ